MSHRTHKLLEFFMEFNTNESVVLIPDGEQFFLYDADSAPGVQIMPVSFENAKAWVLDELLDTVNRDDVVALKHLFLVSKRHARHLGLALPEEFEADPGVRYVLVIDNERKLLSGEHLELVSALMQEGVEVL